MVAQSMSAISPHPPESHGLLADRTVVVTAASGTGIGFATADSIDLAEVNRRLPIEVHHGSVDPVVPESLGREGAEKVESLHRLEDTPPLL